MEEEYSKGKDQNDPIRPKKKIPKYCPDCRIEMVQYNDLEYHCPYCNTILYLTNQDQVYKQRKEPVKPKEKEPEKLIFCKRCGTLIERGSYCYDCTFLQIRDLQQQDRLRSVGYETDNYGRIRYKGFHKKIF